MISGESRWPLKLHYYECGSHSTRRALRVFDWDTNRDSEEISPELKGLAAPISRRARHFPTPTGWCMSVGDGDSCSKVYSTAIPNSGVV